MSDWKLDIGAAVIGKEKVRFRVWAPMIENLSVRIVSEDSGREILLQKDSRGYFEGITEDVHPGDRYFYKLEGLRERPDPASRLQPEGVHGPSAVVDPDEFRWGDNDWKGISLKDYLIYELHVGTFTRDGTFESVIKHLDYLKGLGITAIELMPVSQFPGERNWGYDGVYPFAPQNSYGGPLGLKRLINECHKKGLAVILDVVYNHLGPEGNYLSEFGPYFTDKYRTPWGSAMNYDGPYSDEVRRYFISNALYWIMEYHVDALRLDAIHGIFDFSPRHILLDLGEAVKKETEKTERQVYVIPESDLNDVRVIQPADIGGYGMDAQWNDDFHHALRTLITGETKGYYVDFGKIGQIEKAYREGFVFSGEYSRYRKKMHGSSTRDRPAWQFIVFSQNHDQVGNRMMGDRLSMTQSFEKLKLAAAAVILSPSIPLLFMGEEYAEVSPFQYFVSHSDEGLIEAVRKGRRADFASFHWEGEVPDPQAEATFMNSKINIDLHRYERHHLMFNFYQELIRLRKEVPSLSCLSSENMGVKGFEDEKVLLVRRWHHDDHVFLLYNFNKNGVSMKFRLPDGIWEKKLDSCATEWDGKGSLSVQHLSSFGSEVEISLNPHGFLMYRRVSEKEGK